VAESAGRRDAASEPVVNLAVTLAESGGKPDDYAGLLDELRRPPYGAQNGVRFALIENEQPIAQAVRNHLKS